MKNKNKMDETKKINQNKKKNKKTKFTENRNISFFYAISQFAQKNVFFFVFLYGVIVFLMFHKSIVAKAEILNVLNFRKNNFLQRET